MEIALVLTREVTVMALIIGVGVYTRKKGIFTTELASKLAELLIAIITPIMLFNAFQREKNPALMAGFWVMLILVFVVFTLSAVFSTLIFRPKDASSDHKIARLAVTLPNCGYMGFPLLLATTGESSLLYGAAMIGVFQVFTWLWAIPMIDGKRPSLKRIIINPGIIAFAAGLTLFLLEIRLPRVILSFMNQISSLNTPLSMLMTGVFLADVKLSDTLRAPIIYKTVFLRNLAIPAASVFLVYALNFTAYFGKTFSLSFIILIACSSAASTLLLPIRVGIDGSRGSQMIAASSLLSIITLPFIAFVAEKIL